jgi:acylpyruvate hydrolase
MPRRKPPTGKATKMTTRDLPRVKGEGLPVGKILAVGRNYAAHVREMKARSEPVLFQKPITSLVLPGETVPLPRGHGPVHHELELLVQLQEGGKNLEPSEAEALVGAYGLGLDLTLREVQTEAKERGGPWTLAKGFDHSLPVTPFLAAGEVGDPGQLRFSLEVDGELRQEGCSSDMVHSVGELLAWVSRWITWEPGDLLLTGTPEGVAEVLPGQTARLSLGSLLETEIHFS